MISLFDFKKGLRYLRGKKGEEEWRSLPSQLAAVINFPLELLHAWKSRHLGIPACAHCGNQALEAAIGRVIDDPAALIVLVRLGDLEVESRLALETVALPQQPELFDDFLAIWVAP